MPVSPSPPLPPSLLLPWLPLSPPPQPLSAAIAATIAAAFWLIVIYINCFLCFHCHFYHHSIPIGRRLCHHLNRRLLLLLPLFGLLLYAPASASVSAVISSCRLRRCLQQRLHRRLHCRHRLLVAAQPSPARRGIEGDTCCGRTLFFACDHL